MKRSIIFTSLLGLLLAGQPVQAKANKISSVRVGFLQKEYVTASSTRKAEILKTLEEGGYPAIAMQLQKATPAKAALIKEIPAEEKLKEIQKEQQNIIIVEKEIKQDIAQSEKEQQELKNKQAKEREKEAQEILKLEAAKKKLLEEKNQEEEARKKARELEEAKAKQLQDELRREQEEKLIREELKKLEEEEKAIAAQQKRIAEEKRKAEEQRLLDEKRKGKEQEEGKAEANFKKELALAKNALNQAQKMTFAAASQYKVDIADNAFNQFTNSPFYKEHSENSDVKQIHQEYLKLITSAKKRVKEAELQKTEKAQKTANPQASLDALLTKAKQGSHKLKEQQTAQYLAVKKEIARINGNVEANALKQAAVKRERDISGDKDKYYVSIEEKHFASPEYGNNEYAYYQLLDKKQNELWDDAGRGNRATGYDTQPTYKLRDDFYVTPSGTAIDKEQKLKSELVNWEK